MRARGTDGHALIEQPEEVVVGVALQPVHRLDGEQEREEDGVRHNEVGDPRAIFSRGREARLGAEG